jgi:iron complex outermembrane receptor protein
MQHSFKPSRLAWVVALALSSVQAQESTVVLGK